MEIVSPNIQIPEYILEPDETGNKYFRVYNFDGTLPNWSELLVPHRKDHYLFVLVRRGSMRQWIDMVPYTLKENSVYFSGPNQIIVKEEFKPIWSTGIAFTKEFLSLQENANISKLPVILNPQNGHELVLCGC